MTLAQALARHQFKRVGVETRVTSRSDVEAAFAKIQPSRVRNANKLWLELYPPCNATEGDAADIATRENRRHTVRFPESEGSLVTLASFEVEDDVALRTPALWSLGAGVSKAYRERLRLRAEAAAVSAAEASNWPPLPHDYDPNVVWSILSDGQAFLTPTMAWAGSDPNLPPRRPGFVRFVCISDTHKRHGDLVDLPEGDVLLHAGDFTLAGTVSQVAGFAGWIGAQPFERKFVIAGNHDVTFDGAFAKRQKFLCVENVSREAVAEAFVTHAGDSVTYLEDEEVSFRGIRIFGSPYQPEFGNWAFQRRRGPPMAEKWRQIPSGIDVLLVHGPPLGRGDLCNTGMRAGCADLLAEIQGRVRPAFCVFGHIHEAAGMSFDGTTHYLNAASLGPKMRAVEHEPLVFDLPAREEAAGR